MPKPPTGSGLPPLSGAPKAQKDPFGLGLTIPTPRVVDAPRAPEPSAAEFEAPQVENVAVEVPAVELPKFDFGEAATPAPSPSRPSSVELAPEIPDDDVLFEEPHLASDPPATEVKVDLNESSVSGSDDLLGGEIPVDHEEPVHAPEAETDFSDLIPQTTPKAVEVAPLIASEPEVDFGLPPEPAPLPAPPPLPRPALAVVEPIRAAPPAAAPPAASGDAAIEARLREALSLASRELIERIAWEVVPQLAEAIIRQELDRLVKERQGQ